MKHLRSDALSLVFIGLLITSCTSSSAPHTANIEDATLTPSDPSASELILTISKIEAFPIAITYFLANEGDRPLSVASAALKFDMPRDIRLRDSDGDTWRLSQIGTPGSNYEPPLSSMIAEVEVGPRQHTPPMRDELGGYLLAGPKGKPIPQELSWTVSSDLEARAPAHAPITKVHIQGRGVVQVQSRDAP